MNLYPSYKVSPIADLAILMKEKGLWMHAEACMGGFLPPCFRRLGAVEIFLLFRA
jgi:glutamate/tyrosine decarboxylase-like PLP-dependent enzyme